MTSIKGYVLVVSGVLLCPCHLPLLAVVFAGTAVGSFIASYQSLFVPLMAFYFIGALFLGLRWMTRTGEIACHSCESLTIDRVEPSRPGKEAEGQGDGSEVERTPVGASGAAALAAVPKKGRGL